jgi:peptidoglycan/xylan/chitin deacetylase (PgdA/CDA1 family)
MNSIVSYACVPAVLLALSANGLAADVAADPTPQIIVLKLDDITTAGATGDLPISPRWQRVTDFLEESNLKGSYGIIGFSLEEDNPAYFKWIKDLHEAGFIEFWNHGYRNRKSTDKTGEFEEPYKVQKEALQRTQKLAREKLGIEFKAFGPHWSGTTNDTAKALEQVPGIVMWFYGNPRISKKFVFKRVLTLENPTHIPDFDKFKQRYEQVGRSEKCLALQGHPRSWDDERWENFVRIIEYLKSQGCVFMTPSQYLATVE